MSNMQEFMDSNMQDCKNEMDVTVLQSQAGRCGRLLNWGGSSDPAGADRGYVRGRRSINDGMSLLFGSLLQEGGFIQNQC
jgi:hypothetical protein